MTFKERAHDLFIPIRRKQRPLSTDSNSLSTSSLSTNSSAPPRTPSKQITGHAGSNASAKSSTFIPSSGIRYNVAPRSKSSSILKFMPKSSSPLKSETLERNIADAGSGDSLSAKHNVKHSRNFSTPVPLMVRQTSPLKSISPPKHFQHLIDSDSLESQIAEEQDVRMSIPTPFPSPESHSDGAVSYSDHFTIDSLTSLVSARASNMPSRRSLMDQIVERPHSRDSSLSSRDRAHPPSSFPTALVDTMSNAWPSTARNLQASTGNTRSDRQKKRYTILGVPSHTANADLTPVRRRNSIDQYTKTSSVAHPEVALQQPYDGSHERDPIEFLRQSIRPPSQSASRPSSRHSRSSSSQYPAKNDYSFHTSIHHYTTCSHTSPPSSRPLNEQPYIETFDASAAPNTDSVRSVIRGSCFDCDTAARRDAETQILLRFSPEISRLTNDLTYIISTLEETDLSQAFSISPPRTPVNRAAGLSDKLSPGKSSTMTGRTIDSASTEHTTQTNIFTDTNSMTSQSSQETIESLSRQISHLQQIITQLSTQRDNEVNTIWDGYSARWGPGTLGVVQTKRPASMSSRSASRAGSFSRPISMIEGSRQVETLERYYTPSGHASRVSSARHSPQKSTFSELSVLEQEHHNDSTERFQTPFDSRLDQTSTPASDRRSKRYSTGTPIRSLHPSIMNHSRNHSRDSTPNTPFGSRSVARTETGISYSHSDTPVGRMKVNWLRNRDPP